MPNICQVNMPRKVQATPQNSLAVPFNPQFVKIQSFCTAAHIQLFLNKYGQKLSIETNQFGKKFLFFIRCKKFG